MLTTPIDIDLDSPLTVGLSVGVAIADSSDATPNDLLRDADTAMYIDKASRDTERDRKRASPKLTPPLLQTAGFAPAV